MPVDRVDLHQETLTSLPLRLETILLTPFSHGSHHSSSSQCLPDADCSGYSGYRTHLLAPGGTHPSKSPCLPDADCSGFSTGGHHYDGGHFYGSRYPYRHTYQH